MASSNQNVQTLTDFVRYGNTSTYSVPLTTFLRRVDEFLLLDSFTYEKYHKLLFGLSSFVELTDEELAVYRFKPDFISYRLYGTPNLAHLLLYLNKCAEYEFDKKRIRYITSENLNDIFTLIIANEDERMKRNNKNAAR